MSTAPFARSSAGTPSSFGTATERYELTADAIVRVSASEDRRWAIHFDDVKQVELKRGQGNDASCKLTVPSGAFRTIGTKDFGAPTPVSLAAYRELVTSLHRELGRRATPSAFVRGSNVGWAFTKVAPVLYPLLVVAAVLFLLVRPNATSLMLVAMMISGWATSVPAVKVSRLNGKRASYDPLALPGELLPDA